MSAINKAKENSGNKSSFKKLLATASTLAMIAGASSSAEANLHHDIGVIGNITLEETIAPNNVLNEAGGAAEAWVAANSFYFNNPAGLTLGSNANAGSVATLDLNGSAGVNITVAENSTIGSIINSSAGNEAATLKVNDGKTLTFSKVDGLQHGGGAQDGGYYTAIESIKLGHDLGNAGTLEINVATELGCTIDTRADADVANAGDITIKQPTIFNGAVGEQGFIGIIAAEADSVFNSNVSVNSLQIGDAEVKLNADFTGTTIEALAGHANEGTLVINKNFKVTGKVGRAFHLKAINLKGGNGTFEETVHANEISLDGGNGTFEETITGDVVSTEQKGILTAHKINGNLDLTQGGIINSVGEVTGNVTLDADAQVKNSTGKIGGDLNIATNASFVGTDATDVTGDVLIETNSLTVNKLHNLVRTAMLAKGSLEMNDAITPGHTVSVQGVNSFLKMRDGFQVNINKGTANIRNISEILIVRDGGKVTMHNSTADGTDVLAAISVNDRGSYLEMNDVTGTRNRDNGIYTVMVGDRGSLKMHDATGASSYLFVRNGTLEMNDATDINSNLEISDNTSLKANNIAGKLSVSIISNAEVTGNLNTVKIDRISQLTLTGQSGKTVTNIDSEGLVIVQKDRTFANITKLKNLKIQGNGTEVTLTTGTINDTTVTTTETDRSQNIIVCKPKHQT